MAHDNDEGGGQLAWFLAGAAIGAAIAILLAPTSGKEARKFIKDKTKEGKELVSDTGHEVMERSRELFDRGRQIVDDAAELFERGRKLVRG